MLSAPGHVKALEQAVGALAVEQRVDLDPCHGAARRDGTRPITAVARLAHLHRPDMERPWALPQQPVVIQLGVFLKHDLGDGIGTVDVVARPRVALHQREPAVGAQHHQGPGVHDAVRRLPRSGQESQVDGPVQGPVGAQVNGAAVFHKGGVEGSEGVAVVVGVASQMRLHPRHPALQHVGQPPHENVVAVRRRAVGIVASPRERQLVALPTAGSERIPAPRQAPGRRVRGPQAGLSQRIQARVLPFLVPGRRKAQGAETLHGAAAQISGPGAAVPRRPRAELLEVLEVALLLRRHRGHAPVASPAASSTQE